MFGHWSLLKVFAVVLSHIKGEKVVQASVLPCLLWPPLDLAELPSASFPASPHLPLLFSPLIASYSLTPTPTPRLSRACRQSLRFGALLLQAHALAPAPKPSFSPPFDPNGSEWTQGVRSLSLFRLFFSSRCKMIHKTRFLILLTS